MKIKNWNQFQHFKDRLPPWIKLYRSLLDDPDWHELTPIDAKVLVMLWLVASEDKQKSGTLPCARKLAFRLRITESQLSKSLQSLKNWLIQDDINAISSGYQGDAPETETETETETDIKVGQKPRPAPFSEVISYLNEKTKRNYKAGSKATQGHIRARWNEGFSLDDFKSVIDAKCTEWLTDTTMAKYLRPETLFGTKFEGYLQAVNNSTVQLQDGNRCESCSYNQRSRCLNLSREGFDPGKCKAYRDAKEHVG